MKNEDFQEITERLSELTPHQRKQVVEQLKQIDHVSASKAMIESRLLDDMCCPKCQDKQVVRWGCVSGIQRYRCKGCRSTFNALTATPLARLRHKDRWLKYAEQMLEGKSVRASAEVCKVHRTTSFRWRHRFLELPNLHKATQLQGIVEGDETYFRESFKGQRKAMPRPAHKRGKPASKRGLSTEQIPVLICRDRAGHTSNSVLEKDDKTHICQVMKPIVSQDSIFCSDSSKAMIAAARELKLTHRAINVSAGIRVIAKVYHIQNVKCL